MYYFLIANIFVSALILSGCIYFTFKYPRRDQDRHWVNFLIAYFALIALTRFYLIFTQRQDLHWWFLSFMRCGADITAVYYVVTTFQRSLIMLDAQNDQLILEAKKNHEKQFIIEDQRAKMLYSSQMASISKLSGVMAHEINNPITSISLNAELLMKRGQNNLSEDQKKKLQNIYNLTIRVSEVIKRFLALSNLRESSVSERCPLEDIIRNTLNICGPTFANNINLTVDDIPNVSLNCRPAQLTQALLNLLFNSLDAVQDLSQKWVRLQFEDKQDKVLIRVVDSGKGISPDIVDKIMEPFLQPKM